MYLTIPVMADQVACISKDDTFRVLEFLKNTKNLKFFCAPCNNNFPKTVTIETITSVKMNDKDYWGDYVNGKLIDLAYTYFPFYHKWRNLAMALQFPVHDVPEYLE